MSIHHQLSFQSYTEHIVINYRIWDSQTLGYHKFGKKNQ